MNYIQQVHSVNTSLYLGNVKDLAEPSASDVDMWHKFYARFVNSHVASLVDRAEQIVMPYKFQLYEPFRLPSDLTNFNLSYEECCLLRAEELLNHSTKTGLPITLLYSGGIDSTMVAVSFLKIKTNLRDQVNVAMTPESIVENPNFYYNYIRPNFNLKSSEHFSSFFDGKTIIVGGEHNDQLLGSDTAEKIQTKFGFDRMHEPYKNKLMHEWFLANDIPKNCADWWFDMLVWSAEQAPCEIKSFYDLGWWLNFNFKWQSIFFRTLLRVGKKYRANINQEFVDNNYFQFYSSENFQKWAMINPHLKIKNTWDTYKFHPKELIYDFTKDYNYKTNKVKQGSLANIFISKDTPIGLTTDYQYLYELDKTELYNPVNSFKGSPPWNS
jgi:hypothetical protein